MLAPRWMSDPLHSGVDLLGGLTNPLRCPDQQHHEAITASAKHQTFWPGHVTQDAVDLVQ